jgi:hypothetical protein
VGSRNASPTACRPTFVPAVEVAFASQAHTINVHILRTDVIAAHADSLSKRRHREGSDPLRSGRRATRTGPVDARRNGRLHRPRLLKPLPPGVGDATPLIERWSFENSSESTLAHPTPPLFETFDPSSVCGPDRHR